MFAVIRTGYLHLESKKSVALYLEKEWDFYFVCSDGNKPEENTVVMDVGLS